MKSRELNSVNTKFANFEHFTTFEPYPHTELIGEESEMEKGLHHLADHYP
jgi:hypothetical protein